MCIRDRHEGVGVRAAAGLDGRHLLRVLEVRDIEDADATEAVSYTHLRAHETVLDIVCRLLLDKKKEREPETTLVEQSTIELCVLYIPIAVCVCKQHT